MVKYVNESGNVSYLTKEEFVELITKSIKLNKAIKKKKRIDKMRSNWNKG